MDDHLTARTDSPVLFRAGNFEFPLGGRTYIVGILNVTPDSFSDGGRFADPDLAIRHARRLMADGADILDIGGESTRPGSDPVDAETEMQRVIPVIRRVYDELGCPISVDTYKPEVARVALQAGACIVNDINGLQGDTGMADIVARGKAGVILMHNARIYRQNEPILEPDSDILADVTGFLRNSCRIAEAAGIQKERLILDPGIGFGVTAGESIEMIARLDELRALGLPILLGPSRKRFISHVLGQTPTSRLFGTGASVAMGISRGVDFVRVHDVREIAEVAAMADAIERADRPDRRWRR